MKTVTACECSYMHPFSVQLDDVDMCKLFALLHVVYRSAATVYRKNYCTILIEYTNMTDCVCLLCTCCSL